ncbi:hypothetical protein [Psychrobacillus sp. NPDC096623]|uniref:hypothetical protein n=1 Tax=Psychrobacillus sp. NPDC096623 TaxID=3364492 RepID=UPI003825D716
MSNDLCFVMQPFDRARFDNRYKDIFEPALIAAGLNPYRVDNDPSAVIPIDTIENQIRNARICFAEITTNNPNVWFELGYAIACKKDIILVSCKNEREGDFPFDVKHRSVIMYDTDSPRSYNLLQQQITEKAKALLAIQRPIISIDQEFVETKDLSVQEIIILSRALVNSLDYESGLKVSEIHEEMANHSYDGVAGALAIKKLLLKEMIEEFTLTENNGFQEYTYKEYEITALGEEWLLHNEDKIVKKNSSNTEVNKLVLRVPYDDGLPF